MVSKITLKNLGVLNLKHVTFHYDNQYALDIAKNVVFMNALNILILTVILLDTTFYKGYLILLCFAFHERTKHIDIAC